MCPFERRCGKGRDDYPVRPMWNAVIAGIVFQHPSIESDDEPPSSLCEVPVM